jgi:hypothetical protein
MAEERFRITRRRAAARKECPNCGREYGYYWFSGMGDIAPHFYCDRCSNVYFREAHRRLLYEREASRQLVDEIASSLPDCPCGGRFLPGAGPKCPHCRFEFQHQDDPVKRLDDPHAILVGRAALLTED